MPVTTQLHEHAEALLVWNKTCFYEVLAPFYRKVCNIPFALSVTHVSCMAADMSSNLPAGSARPDSGRSTHHLHRSL